MTVFFPKKKELHLKAYASFRQKNGVPCTWSDGKFPAHILIGCVGEEMFTLEKARNWCQD